jgi:hypothetical protein
MENVMLCKALILGVERIKSPAAAEKSYDFHKVNFIDTENPSGSPQSMTLPNDPQELQACLPQFEASRLKVVSVNVYQNGKYNNFGSFIK